MALIDNMKAGFGKLGFYPAKIEDENTGNVRYYARLVPYSKKTKEEINRWAASFMKISEAQMRMAFEALAEAIQYFTLSGHSVTLEGVGTFNLSSKTGIWDEKTKTWKSAGKTSMSDVSANDIRNVYVRFRPSVQLRSHMANCHLFDLTKVPFGKQLLGITDATPADSGSEGGN